MQTEWQPAVIINAHREVPAHDVIKPLIGKRVRLREITRSEPDMVAWLQEDCDTQRAFEVHWEDFKSHTGEYGRYVACEHEILTD